jgi:hypothetical protein
MWHKLSGNRDIRKSEISRMVSSHSNLSTGGLQTTPLLFHGLRGTNNLATENRENSSIMSLVSSPKNLSTNSHTALSLFNGQTSFNRPSQDVLVNELILSKQAADGASFFCNSRGLYCMFQESDIERYCKNIVQNLHENSAEGEEGSVWESESL